MQKAAPSTKLQLTEQGFDGTSIYSDRENEVAWTSGNMGKEPVTVAEEWTDHNPQQVPCLKSIKKGLIAGGEMWDDVHNFIPVTFNL